MTQNPQAEKPLAKNPQIQNQALLFQQAPIIILARPQMGENIGATARAMKNCGLYELRLVAPRDGWPNPLAEPIATIGKDILDRATVYDNLADALIGINFLVATSARPRDLEKPVMTPRDAAAQLIKKQALNFASASHVALLFGAERSGLDNDELALADCIAQAPLHPGSTSLNLAQAVLVMAWEWRMAALLSGGGGQALIKEGVSAAADLKTREFFLERLGDILDKKGFFPNQEMAPVGKRNLRCLFSRAAPTDQELRTLHGILTLFDR